MSSSSSSSSSLRNSYLYGDDIPIDVSDYGLGYMGETPKLVSARNIGDRVKKQQTKTKANMMVTRPKSARVKTKVKMSQKSFPCKSIDLKSTLVADDITYVHVQCVVIPPPFLLCFFPLRFLLFSLHLPQRVGQ